MPQYQFTVTVPFSTDAKLPDGSGAVEATATPGVYRFVRNGIAVEFSSAAPIPAGPGVVVQTAAS